MKLFVSPHNDDAVLFGSFTLQRQWPQVLTVFDSHVQVARGHVGCSAAARRAEDRAAMSILGCEVDFAGVGDDEQCDDPWFRSLVYEVLERWRPDEVWLPAIEEGGHPQHNLVGEIGADLFRSAQVHFYLTYTTAGKSTGGRRVPCTGAMVLKKLQSLACYRTQIEIDALDCWPHFLRDQSEYLAT